MKQRSGGAEERSAVINTAAVIILRQKALKTQDGEPHLFWKK